MWVWGSLIYMEHEVYEAYLRVRPSNVNTNICICQGWEARPHAQLTEKFKSINIF